ncbi:OmpA family protein [Cytophagaceae bacterium ABcell3]|nr:OmpA family protein [Cytophagaceae bacterium ABcell3]
MKKILPFLTLCLLLASKDILAQKVNKAAKKSYNKGMSHYMDNDFTEAIKYFSVAEENDPKNPLIHYYKGVSLLKHHRLPLAIESLKKAKSLKLENEPELHYYLGRAYHLYHKFNEAITSYQTYYTLLKDAEKNKKAKVKKLIANCETGIVLMFNPLEVEIENLGENINTEDPEYNPVISADETTLYFTSRRSSSTGGLIDPEDGYFYEDIYVSHKNDSAWSEVEKIGGKINTENHDACIGLSADGQQMLIYNSTSNNGDIYISTLEGENWSKPTSLGPNVNTDGWESSASLSADNQTLFFTSDRKGGYGGTDIYMSKRSKAGEFGEAILLGPQVNTPDDEIAPFIHADGKTLYFSSQGHKSMGGFDIFSVEIDLETGEILSDPENIGYPINTADDDTYFVWSADNTRAYFSSIREEGLGDKDIYMLERNIAFAPLIVWKGSIKDAVTNKAVEAQIVVTDNKTGKEIGRYTSNSSSGNYVVILPAGRNYGLAIEAEGYAFFSKNIDIPDLETYEEITDQVALNPLVKGSVIVLRNVFFDTDKADLRKESIAELNRLAQMLKEEEKVKKVEIGGHTDSDGEAEHNLKLSKERAKSVYEYLISIGVNEKMLSYKGYGETKPQVPNDSPKNKQLNRRTEISVIE